MGPESDAKIKRAVAAFVNGNDGKVDASMRHSAFDELGRVLVEEGRLLDLAFLNEVMRKLPPTLGDKAIDMLRNAFFLGARSAVRMLEVPDGQTEVTDDDLLRIEGMRAEIEAFSDELTRRTEINTAMQMKTAGNA